MRTANMVPSFAPGQCVWLPGMAEGNKDVIHDGLPRGSSSHDAAFIPRVVAVGEM